MNPLRLVNITENGAILLGRYFEVDGFGGRPVRVVTHAHIDHLNELEQSLFTASRIVATPITIEFIKSLGYFSHRALRLLNQKTHILGYHEEFLYEDEKLILYQADHIPGAAQVLLESQNHKLAYTGDFKLTGKTEVIREPDVLVIESTYGHPSNMRPFKEYVPSLLIDIVNEGLRKYGIVFIYGYHGKLQEAMNILREGGIDATFLLPGKICTSTKILEKYGYNIGQHICMEGDDVPKWKPKRPVVVFQHFNKAKYRKLGNDSLHIVLSGWLFEEPFKKIDECTYIVGLSDHADFSDLIKYVELSNPRIIVVDGSREGSPGELVHALLERGFCAITLPKMRDLTGENKCAEITGSPL